jgi:L-ascorbate metabolism protein UlaG (beta-lactamase superfamily)
MMAPEKGVPAVKPQKTASGGRLHIKYLGTNCILIGDGKTQWMLDPHFTRPGKLDLLKRLNPDRARIGAVLADAGIDELQAVILSHTHYDHALDAVETCRLTGAKLVGSRSTRWLCMGAGFPLHWMQEVQDGESMSLGDFQVTFFPNWHILLSRLFNAVSGMHGHIDRPFPPAAYFWEYREGTVFTLLVQHPRKSFLIGSSAGFFVNKPPNLKVDFSILSIGGLLLKSKTYLRRYLQQMAIDLGAGKVLLSHWDDFTTPLSDHLRWMLGSRRIVKRILDQAQESDLEIEVLPYNKAIHV